MPNDTPPPPIPPPIDLDAPPEEEKAPKQPPPPKPNARADINKFRSLLNENSSLGTILAVVVLIGALGAIVWQITPKPPPIQDVYYYDMNTGELFVSEPVDMAPIEAPSGPLNKAHPEWGAEVGDPAGVRAYVFACESCSDSEDRFIGWLSTHPPDIKQLIQRSEAQYYNYNQGMGEPGMGGPGMDGPPSEEDPVAGGAEPLTPEEQQKLDEAYMNGPLLRRGDTLKGADVKPQDLGPIDLTKERETNEEGEKKDPSLWFHEYEDGGFEITEWPREHCKSEQYPDPCFP